MSPRKLVAPFRSIVLACMVVSLLPAAGCRICADCEDLAYPAYGGAWQRTKRDSGRVGSIFDPAGGKASDLTNRDQPLSADAIERQRQVERGSNLTDPDRQPDETLEATPDTEGTPENELRNRELEDIPDSEKEEQLRNKNLDEIKVHLMPSMPEPAALQ